MQPTVGRIVNFHPTPQVTWAAVITDVHANGSVDLTVFAPARPIQHRQEARMGVGQGQWTWPTIQPATEEDETSE